MLVNVDRILTAKQKGLREGANSNWDIRNVFNLGAIPYYLRENIDLFYRWRAKPIEVEDLQVEVNSDQNSYEQNANSDGNDSNEILQTDQQTISLNFEALRMLKVSFKAINQQVI